MAPPGRVVPLTAPTAGRVEWPAQGGPAAGARVKAGQTLIRLTPLADAAPRSARDLRGGRQGGGARGWRSAGQQLERARQLLRYCAGSQRDVERAEQEFAQAKAAADAAAERTARLTDHPLDGDVTVPLTAPFDGVISQLHVGRGQVVS